MLGGFQKNLVVWKPLLYSKHFSGYIYVSEELSSVETNTWQKFKKVIDMFQKNLVVWKLL